MGKNPCSEYDYGGRYQCIPIRAGKAVRSLIEWQFNEQYEDARKEIKEFGITEKDLKEDGVEVRLKAYYPPQVSLTAYYIYSFLRQNSNLVTIAGGMGHFVTGIDRAKLMQVAPYYGIEFGRILPYVALYESEMLKRQERLQNQS